MHLISTIVVILSALYAVSAAPAEKDEGTISYLSEVPNTTPQLFARAPEPALSASQINEMLNLVNNLRASRGAGALRLDSRFIRVAQAQSDYQASICTMTHNYNGQSGLISKVNAIVGSTGLTAVAENVGAGQSTVAQVFEAWKNSAGHLTNMVNPNYNAFGTAVTVNNGCSKYKTYWTQIFARVSTIVPPTTGGTKGDWEFCSTSSECANQCCSNEWSDDGRLKCSPGSLKCV